MCEHMKRLKITQFRLTDVMRDFYCPECGYQLIIGLPVKIVFWIIQMIFMWMFSMFNSYHPRDPRALLLVFSWFAEAYFLGYGAYLYVYQREIKNRMNKRK